MKGTYKKGHFLRNVLRTGCQYLDIVTFHTYQGNSVQSRVGKIEELAAIARENCQKPIWVTEFGIKASGITEETQGDLINGIFEQGINVPGVEKIFQYRMSNHYLNEEGYGLVEQNVFNSEVIRYKLGFYEVQDFLVSLPKAYDLDFRTLLNYTDFLGKKRSLLLDEDYNQNSFFFDPSEKLVVRTISAPGASAECFYGVNGEEPQNSCLANNEYIFGPNYFQNPISIELEGFREGETQSRFFNLYPFEETFNLVFQLKYTDQNGIKKTILANLEHPSVEVSDINIQKPMEFEILSSMEGVDCRFESIDSQGGCLVNYQYLFPPGFFSTHWFFEIKTTLNEVSQFRKIQWNLEE